MVSAALRDELAEQFNEVASVNIEDLGLTDTCLSICQTYGLSAEDLAIKWEAFSMRNEGGSVIERKALTLANLDDFRAKVLSKLRVAQPQFMSKGGRGASVTRETLHQFDARKRTRDSAVAPDIAFGTPAGAGARGGDEAESPLTSGPSSQYVERKNAGKIETTLNPELGIRAAGRARTRALEVDTSEWHGAEGIGRHMWERLEDKAAAIDKHAHDLGMAICASAGLDAPGNVMRATVDETTAVGRICCDSEGKVNPQVRAARARALAEQRVTTAWGAGSAGCPCAPPPCGLCPLFKPRGRPRCPSRPHRAAPPLSHPPGTQSVFLETTRASSAGVRIKLELSDLPDFVIFRGQVVAVRGTNARGHALAVRAIHSCAPRPPPAVPAPPASSSAGAEGTGGARVLVACGPYTTADSLGYGPLLDLLAAAERHVPDAIVLLGPFVDEAHPSVKAAALGALTFESLFREKVRRLCRARPRTGRAARSARACSALRARLLLRLRLCRLAALRPPPSSAPTPNRHSPAHNRHRPHPPIRTTHRPLAVQQSLPGGRRAPRLARQAARERPHATDNRARALVQRRACAPHLSSGAARRAR